MTATFIASTQLANGMINEKGIYSAADQGSNSIKYLLSVHHINLQPVLKSLHFDNLIKGTANLTAHLTANNSGSGWLSNLNGSGNFKLTDTELGKLNSVHYLNQAFELLHQQKIEDDNGVTVFSNISGSFTLHDGVFYNDDLKMNARKITSTGTGNINLNTRMINYKLYLAQNNNEFKLPLDISGPLEHPQIKPDLANLGKDLIKKSIKKKIFDNIFHGKHIDFKKIF